MTAAHSLDSLHFSCSRQPAGAWVDGPVSVCRRPRGGEGRQDGGPQGSQSQGGRGLLTRLLSSGDDGDGSKYDSQASQEERAGAPEMRWRGWTPLSSPSRPRGSHSCWAHAPSRPWCREGTVVPSSAVSLLCLFVSLCIRGPGNRRRNHLAS